MFAQSVSRGRGGAARRRALALAGAAVVLGVVVLNAQAALSDHPHVHGAETLGLTSLAAATLAALGLWLGVPRSRPALPCDPLDPAVNPPVTGMAPALRARRRGAPAPLLVLRR